ncbi:hypothetical protein OG863_03240 [Streptomyces decoyicus]|uniref:Thioredoxin n=1 Tax=Streptomyces decoyicus TaxID=249567 RepID=A0ABZ1FAM7_9ACTN|nr:hypothetical protein [Streptomyces decoyicus]WSB67060.1 hypothetical protein OG863_03240 [Streptomyces decoyicus]
MSARATTAPAAAAQADDGPQAATVQADAPHGTAPHAAAPNAEATGRRVEEVLDRLAQRDDREAGAAAEELVRVLMDFYGAGLARIMHLLGSGTDNGGPGSALLRDELVTSLLVLHDLHPEDTAARIGRALDSVRRQHPAEVAEFDADSGTLRLRSGDLGGCGCPSTNQQAQQAVEAAVSCFAPEVTSVRWEAAGARKEPALLQIARRPPTAATAS